MNIPAYSLRLSGDEETCRKRLGEAKKLLYLAREGMTRSNTDMPSFYMNKHFPEDGVRISVIATKYGNDIIYISAPMGKEKKPKVNRRERILHCRLEITVADDVPPYEGDPSFVAFEPIPILDEEVGGVDPKVYLHFIYNVDSNVVYDISSLKVEKEGETRPVDFTPDMTINDVYEEVEEFIEAKRLKKIDKFGYPIEFLSEEFFEDTILKPEFESSMIPLRDEEDQPITDPKQMGLLDKFDDRVNSSWSENDSKFFYTSNLANKTDQYYYESTHSALLPFQSIVEKNMMDDFILLGPQEKYSFLGSTLYTQFFWNHAIDSGREDYLGWWPTNHFNSMKLLDSIEETIIINTPFTYIMSDFTHFDNVGERSIIEGNESNLTVAGQELKANVFSIIPYQTQWVDSLWDLVHLYAGKTGLSGEPFYNNQEWNEMFFNGLGNLLLCLNLPTDSTEAEILNNGALLYCYGIFNRAHNVYNWLFHPFRNEMWNPELIDFWTIDEFTTHARSEFWHSTNSLSLPWEPGGTESAMPSRLLLCIRSFFANTPNGTSWTTTRKRYDVQYTAAGTSASAPNWFLERRYRDDIDELVDEVLTGHKRLSTYDTVDVEMSPPLTAQYLPTFATEKGDFVHVALLSMIYAEMRKFDEHTIDDVRPSDNWTEPSFAGQGVASTCKRPWCHMQDGEWTYKNTYGAGIVVNFLSTIETFLTDKYDLDYDLRDKSWEVIGGGNKSVLPHILNLKLSKQYGANDTIYDKDEIPIFDDFGLDTGEVKEVTKAFAESHIVEAIYMAMEENGYDRYRPVCDIKLDTVLYEKLITE
jgi:hypothetical protein